VFGLHDAATDSDRLYEIAPDGTGERLLSEGSACCLTLPPDGRAALVAEDVDGLMVPAVLKLSGDSFEESAWSDFAPGLSLLPGAWSKTSDLAFDGWAESDPSKTGIYLSIANGGGGLIGDLVRLTSNPGAQHDIPLAFSPDGSKLLFVRETPNAERTGDLYVIGMGGYLPDKGSGRKHYQPGDLRKLNPTKVGVAVSDVFGPGASWSPDGTRVAFSGFDRAGDAYGETSRAYVVDVVAGETTAITEYSTNMTSAHWSPNGEWIAYDFDHPGGTGGRDVWLVRPDGTDAHQVTVTNGSCCASWSPDSSWLLFQGNDGDGAGLFIASADGSGYGRLLTVDSEYDLRWPGWRP
jgi:WD40 repeat protein